MFGKVESFWRDISVYDLFIGGLATVLVTLFVVQTTTTARKLRRLGH